MRSGRGRTRAKRRVCDLPIYRSVKAVIATAENGRFAADTNSRFHLLHRETRLSPVGVLNAALKDFGESKRESGLYVGPDSENAAAANETAAEILRTLCFPIWDNLRDEGKRSDDDDLGVAVRKAGRRRYHEGALWPVVLDRHERNRQAREKCIDHFGCQCIVCGFDFESAYGELGRDFIHVHHLRELADCDGEREVDPVRDLRPVCATCHAMLHVEKPAMSIEKLRSLVVAQRQEATE